MATLTTTKLVTAQTLPMTLSIQGEGKQYRTKNWGLRDFALELGPGSGPAAPSYPALQAGSASALPFYETLLIE